MSGDSTGLWLLANTSHQNVPFSPNKSKKAQPLTISLPSTRKDGKSLFKPHPSPPLVAQPSPLYWQYRPIFFGLFQALGSLPPNPGDAAADDFISERRDFCSALGKIETKYLCNCYFASIFDFQHLPSLWLWAVLTNLMVSTELDVVHTQTAPAESVQLLTALQDTF